ncbi:MAG: S8 family serine peptidase, partial [Anaerolineales bacterium]|nr:S8 family serine peptidase [Anaerolineales bacterium]
MFRNRIFKVLSNLILLLVFCTGQVAAAPNNKANEPINSMSLESSKVQNAQYPYVPDMILLEVQGGVILESNSQGITGRSYTAGSTSLSAALSSLGMRSVEPLFPSKRVATERQSVNRTDLTKRVYRVQLRSGTDVMGAAETLAALPEVTFAEPDYIAVPADIPTTAQTFPAYSVNSLTIDDPLYDQQWGLAKINIEGAWDDTYGSSTVTIAIIDSGIDLTHPDLSGNLWINPGEIASNGIDDDSNGYIDDVNGWNFVAGNNDISDGTGHGTLVSGVAAAVGGNGQGIAGVCPQCRIMPVKVMLSDTANYSDIAAGVLYAAQKGAKVINLSMGGYANSTLLRNAIDTAVNTYGVVIVAGSGNDNLNQPFYPAAYDNVLAIAGTQSNDAKASFSNYGTWVDVSAPAVDIRTTALGGGWVDNSGTSMAAPFAAGVAGLLRSLHPDWDQDMIRSQISHTTDLIDGLNPSYAGLLGSGRLNAGTAMLAPTPVLSMTGYNVNGQANGSPLLNATAQLTVTLSNDSWNGDALGVTGVLSTTDAHVTIVNGSASYGNIAAGTTKTNAAAFSFSVNSSAGYNHSIPFTLNITDTTGYANSFDFTITTEAEFVSKSGLITVNETWTNDRTYLITNHVTVQPGITLTIQPGTNVLFSGFYAINVGGTLIADGTANQPILFKSNSTEKWDKIFFDDTSTDAQADADGQYISGSILRYVNIEGTGMTGIACTQATPYISHSHISLADTNKSNPVVNCSVGATPLWLLDNDIANLVWIQGAGKAYRNKIGGLVIDGASIVEDNIIEGGLALAVYDSGIGIVRRNTIGGTVEMGTFTGSGGIFEDNSAGGATLGDSFSVVNNTFRGILRSGNNTIVDHNTFFSSNGIVVGNSSIVTWNNVENNITPGTGNGLIAGSNVTAQYNRLIGFSTGMTASTGLIEHNLIANNYYGLRVGAATVRYNTFTGSLGYLVGPPDYYDAAIVVQGGTPLEISNNNIDGNFGKYDLYINIPNGTSVPVQNNWWGTTNAATIAGRIYDSNDDGTKATVNFAPVLTEPDQNAPGYVRSVNVLPDTTLGIQTGTFQAQFSEPMDLNYVPSVRFCDANIFRYDTTNSLLPTNQIYAIAAESNGTKWFGSIAYGVASFDGTSWKVYNKDNSGFSLSDYPVWSIAAESNGTKWFGTNGGGVAHFDGTSWTIYDTSNSGLPDNTIRSIAIESDGTKWFGTNDGVARFDGTSWTIYMDNHWVYSVAIESNGTKWFGSDNGVASFDGASWTSYNTSNSGLPSNMIRSIAIDGDGTKWIGAIDGVTHFNGVSWTVYGAYNSGLPDNTAYSIAIDSNGTKWFGTDRGVASFDGTSWRTFTSLNTRLPSGQVHAIRIDNDGAKWFSADNGVGVFRDSYCFINENQQWSSNVYQATLDITSAIQRGAYHVSVSDAFDSDGMRIAPNSSTTFVVDYAGSISDVTPPLRPTVTASGDGLTTISASWSSSDPQSLITQYRYAIGTTPGGRDVVEWTYVSSTTTSIKRMGLNLTYGQPYYVIVGARNEGGLWSQDGVGNLVIPPSVSSILRASANPTSAAGISFTVTFSESVTGVNVSDFTLTTTGGVSGAAVSGVSGSGSVYTVTIYTGSGSGTVRLDVVDNNSIIDLASNPLGGAAIGDGNFTGGEIYTINKPFAPASRWTSSFDLSHGWTVSQFVRTVGDVNNDGRDDLIGFGLDGVYVSLSTGSGFGAVSKWTSSFDLSHGWTVSQYVRTVGDVNNDGRDDLIGFGLDGVYVALSNGTSFDPVSKWTSSFDLSHGWTVSQFVRTVG